MISLDTILRNCIFQNLGFFRVCYILGSWSFIFFIFGPKSEVRKYCLLSMPTTASKRFLMEGKQMWMLNNSSVWLESKCQGTERNRSRSSHSKGELYFSEVVVEVSCQKPSVARFWQAVTKTKEKESYLKECEKFAWDFGLFQDSYF